MFAYYVLCDLDTIIVVLQLRNMKTKVNIIRSFSIKFKVLYFVKEFPFVLCFFRCRKVPSPPGFINR
jgi:hypothetical protein